MLRVHRYCNTRTRVHVYVLVLVYAQHNSTQPTCAGQDICNPSACAKYLLQYTRVRHTDVECSIERVATCKATYQYSSTFVSVACLYILLLSQLSLFLHFWWKVAKKNHETKLVRPKKKKKPINPRRHVSTSCMSGHAKVSTLP